LSAHRPYLREIEREEGRGGEKEGEMEREGERESEAGREGETQR
jgi:hypothetical protein